MADYNARIAPFINVTFYVTSEWWEPRSYYHKGLDISTGGNDPLYSMFNGRVILKSFDADGFGNYIIIKDDATGVASLYGHMKSVSVNQGDNVTIGQQVGIEGTTGHSTGNHCHLELQDLSSGRDWIFGGQKSDYMNPAEFMGIPNVEGISVFYSGTPGPGPGPTPTPEWIYKDEYLTQAEKENNATIVINYYRSQGINDSTIAAILGNMDLESNIEPWLNERGGTGYGIVQWTPKSDLINACSVLGLSPYDNGDVQIQVILSEIRNTPQSIAQWYTSTGFISNYIASGATTDMIGITGEQFLNNDMAWTPEKLAILFMAGYERPSYDPSSNHYVQRQERARFWFEFMQGVVPPGPTPTPTKKSIEKWYWSKFKKVLIKY